MNSVQRKTERIPTYRKRNEFRPKNNGMNSVLRKKSADITSTLFPNLSSTATACSKRLTRHTSDSVDHFDWLGRFLFEAILHHVSVFDGVVIIIAEDADGFKVKILKEHLSG